MTVSIWRAAAPCVLLCSLTGLLAGCGGTNRLEVIEGQFPVPVMVKAPVRLGIYLDEDLTNFVHKETIESKGKWEVSLGSAQRELFNNLGTGIFEDHRFVEGTSAPQMDGVLKPTIREVQFSLPSQTRSKYYEVWVRYDFELFDKAGTKVGQWVLPAYGKASEKDFGNKMSGMQAAAIAACRDAMAFFSLNFQREKVVYDWIKAGKPLQPLAPPASPAPPPAATGAPTAASANAPGSNSPGPVVASASAAPTGRQADAQTDKQADTPADTQTDKGGQQ
ncbi:MAG: hypothetical protein AAF513_12480 [Pseudomonadota bacterium]